MKFVWKRQYLPPAKEVWGKVMFLHMSVILSKGKGSLYDVTSSLATWSHVPSRGSLSRGTCRGVFVLRESPSLGVCPGGLFCKKKSRGSLSWESLSRDLCPGGSLSRGLCPGGSLSRGCFPDRDCSV